MKLGVVGLPNVGKSTLFNAITKAGAQAANYPAGGKLSVLHDRTQRGSGCRSRRKTDKAGRAFQL